MLSLCRYLSAATNKGRQAYEISYTAYGRTRDLIRTVMYIGIYVNQIVFNYFMATMTEAFRSNVVLDTLFQNTKDGI